MLMIILTTPAKFGFPMVFKIYLSMIFIGVIGVMLFEIIAVEIKNDAIKKPFDTKSKIKDLKASLKK